MSKETGLKVNVDKSKYVVMSIIQNARRIHNINIDNNVFGRLEEFKLNGRVLMYYQYSVQEEIKEQTEFRECLLSFGENLLSSSLL